ncbi:MAG: amidohydrolase [Acidobacteriales bacterium]|nr:amidohydrolase [Terriglobales bacterium]
MKALYLLFCSAVVFPALAVPTPAQTATARQEVETVYPEAHAFYLDLHQSPELSSHETQTAAKLANRLRNLGYEVTESIGGTGVVAILRNGSGPTVMLRTELDALPVEEKTGLPYASKVHTKDDSGRDVSVMHACGHDLHMASLLGTARIMAGSKSSWHGTLMLIGQPAEETISGAKAMIADGLFRRFPKPDVAIALHVFNMLPAGKVGVGPGYRYSNADSVRVTIYGRGGHGAAPETTIDPVLIAARTVLALQTIVSREVKPGEPAVVTVGYLRAGTENNIIPDQAELGITVRTYNPEVRKRVLASLSRIVKAEADAAGVEREPLIDHDQGTDAVFNDPGLDRRISGALVAALGKDNVVPENPQMGSEDFSYFTEQNIPSYYFNLGGAEPGKWEKARAGGESLPSNHSPFFAPDVDPALHTGITAEVAVLRNLMNTGANPR